MYNSAIIDKNLLILLTPQDDSCQFVDSTDLLIAGSNLNCATVDLLCSSIGQVYNSIFLCLTQLER